MKDKKFSVFAENLVRLIGESNASEKSLIKFLKITKGTFADWLSGNSIPEGHKLYLLSEALKVEVAEFFTNNSTHKFLPAKPETLYLHEVLKYRVEKSVADNWIADSILKGKEKLLEVENPDNEYYYVESKIFRKTDLSSMVNL